MKMVVQTKRKNPSEEDLTATTNSKKRKQDISWLTEGIAGTDPFDGKANLFVLTSGFAHN